MRKQALVSMMLMGLIIALSGCATVRAPVIGILYADTKSGMTATSNQSGNRVGEACATSYFGLIATGDASIEAARRNGGITTISSVDETANNVLGIVGKYCTVVRGR